MTKLPWPDKSNIDSFLNNTLETIGRPVEFHYVVATSGCPICSLDPVSNTSTNAFCPVCSGYYWLNILDTATISGHVTWRYSENLSWYSAGQQFTGDCQVRINYYPDVVNIVNATKYVVVDGRVMQIDKINLRGAPDVNRIIITLQEKDKE
jgi:hypothetical protein